MLRNPTLNRNVASLFHCSVPTSVETRHDAFSKPPKPFVDKTLLPVDDGWTRPLYYPYGSLPLNGSEDPQINSFVMRSPMP